jgi:preprotein translocase subunit SecA
MEDTLMRIFGDPERTKSLLSRAGMREGEAIESRLLTRQIERAQRKVEAHNFDIRKNLLEYDDVANDQRKVVYVMRNDLMEADEIEESIAAIREEVVEGVVRQHIPPGSLDEMWDAEGLSNALEAEFGVRADVARWIREDKTLTAEGISARCISEVEQAYAKKTSEIGAELMRGVEKQIMLRQLDFHWKEHLAAMDHLRQGVGLRSYAQKNPKQEYKREGFEMFGEMIEQVKHDSISILSRIRIQGEQDLSALEQRRKKEQAMKFQHAEASALGANRSGGEQPAAAEAHTPFVRDGRKVGRNEECPCGSGKKFKQCHGRLS